MKEISGHDYLNKTMRICIVGGAGAIGGYLSVKLAKFADVTVIARGASLEAITKNGLTLIEDNSTETVFVKAFKEISPEVGKFDVIILAVKGQQIAAIADQLELLCEENTAIITSQNGIPWWYFQRHPNTDYPDYVIKSVDPDGSLAAKIDPKRIIGCVVYPATTVESPGVIRHIEGVRFPIGELDGSESERAKAISEVFTKAGLKCPVLTDIRSEVWLKLWGSCCFNPLSALTHSTLEDMCTHELTRELCKFTMLEAQEIATRLGVTFRVELERRIAGAAAVGQHKTSMLQDVEAGRWSTEVDSLVGAVVELGVLTGIPTPRLHTLYVSVKMLCWTMEKGNLRVSASNA